MARECSCCRVTLKSATLTSGLVSLIFSMSLITACVTSIFYDSSLDGVSLAVLLVNGIVDVVSSICCVHGACTESSKFLLPWIFTASVGIIFLFVASLSYIMYDIDEYVCFGVVVLMLACLFSTGWVCVLSYYYRLCDQKAERDARRALGRQRSREAVAEALPPPYSAVFKNDAPPPYEDVERRY